MKSAKKAKKAKAGDVYLIGARLTPQAESEGYAILPDTDDQGHVIFRKDVEQKKAITGFANCISLANRMIEGASRVSKEYRVESVTLKLALDTEVGCSFLAKGKVEAAIEVEIKRVATEPRQTR
jgi:hypothetical protein